MKHHQNVTHRRGRSTRSCAFRGINMTNAKKRRTHLLTGLASTLLLAGAAAPVYAQVAPPEGEQAPGSLDDDPQTGPVGADGSEPQGEAIVVTGSRIVSHALTAPNPISQISSEEFALTSSATAENLLNTLPQEIGRAHV